MTPNPTGRVNVSAATGAAKERHHEAGTSAPLAAPARPADRGWVLRLPFTRPMSLNDRVSP